MKSNSLQGRQRTGHETNKYQMETQEPLCVCGREMALEGGSGGWPGPRWHYYPEDIKKVTKRGEYPGKRNLPLFCLLHKPTAGLFILKSKLISFLSCRKQYTTFTTGISSIWKKIYSFTHSSVVWREEEFAPRRFPKSFRDGKKGRWCQMRTVWGTPSLYTTDSLDAYPNATWS